MRANATRVLVPALLVLALVGVVTIASTGATPSGTRDSRPPSEAMLDTFFSLFLLLLVPAAAILVYGLMQRKEIARERQLRRTRFLGFVAIMFVFTAIVYLRLRGWDGIILNETDERNFAQEPPTAEPVPPGAPPETYEPEFAWVPVGIVVALVAIGIGAAFLASRRRASTRPDEGAALAEALAAVLDDTLDDLRAEKDPRRAVIAAYARLERTLAAHRLPRRDAETSEEYLTRILPDLEIDPGSVRRLTNLFTRAKFSPHEVDQGMKEEAIDALSTVRDELRTAEERRLEVLRERLQAVPERA